MEAVVTACPMAVPTNPSPHASPDRLLDRRLEELVAVELDRLSRRVPVLADDHLGVVEASLYHVINRLLPARVRAGVRPEALAALFDLEEP
jgi:hypothetical protein